MWWWFLAGRADPAGSRLHGSTGDDSNSRIDFSDHAGKQRMPIRECYPCQKPYRMVYVEDPFGLIFEIYSHSYELIYSAGAY
jgi:hypothetical protein